MAFLLILDREHKVLWVKSKNKVDSNKWILPEVEDPINKPANRLNVELLAKQAFIPLKSSFLGKKTFLDNFHNDQTIYLFLCPGKEASEVMFDLTKYNDIQWIPINCIKETDIFFNLSGKSVIQAYIGIVLNGSIDDKSSFHIVKNGYGKKETNLYNKAIIKEKSRLLIELKEQYSLYHQQLPKVGDYAVLNNWKGVPIAILEITGVSVELFKNLCEVVKKTVDNYKLPCKDIKRRYQKIFSNWSINHNQKFSHTKEVIISQFKIVQQFTDTKIDHLKVD